MSSTYAHYQQPGSIPSDYAILNHMTGREDASNDTHEPEVAEVDMAEYPGSIRINGRTRRPSFQNAYPSSYKNDVSNSYGTLKRKDSSVLLPSSSPSEATPLLNTNEYTIPEETDDKPTVALYWEEAKLLTKFAFPVFGTHILEYSLVVASVVSIGHLSTEALAAITLGSMTASVSGYSIIQGMTSALDTLMPSAWTSTQPELVGLWAQRMSIVMAACCVPISMVWYNAENVLLFLKQEPAVAHLAATYLRWALFGLPAYAFNCVSRRYFQSQGLFAVPTRIILIIAPVNALLNYWLVWGPPKLGFIGAPIATAISFNLVALFSLIYGIFFVPKTAWHPLSRRMFTSLGVLCQLGLAGVGQTASEWWAWELVALAASLLGPVVLATQSVLLVSASCAYQAPFSLSVATSVRIGNLLGDRNAKKAEIAAKTSIMMALVLSGTSSTMFLVFRNTWAYMFNDDPEVVTLTASILPLVALFQVFDGNCAVTAGILRARGKQMLGAALNLSAYYVFGLPFAMWLAFKHNYGIYGLWIGLTMSLVYASIAGSWVSLSTDWEREVIKTHARLAEEDKNRQEAVVPDEERRAI